jgi:uracil-DNA glycosylase family protein
MSLVSAPMADIATKGLERALEAERRIQTGGNLRASFEALLGDALGCQRCDLYRHATQTVFGEGPLEARIMFVGEQPGDQEDLAGRPFVGPAGAVFDAALEQAGIERSSVYVTNAVKHFKFVARGKRRIHSKPDSGEIAACRWWIEQERELVRPLLTVALGATAARSLIGKTVTIGKVRGEPLTLEDGSECWVTAHPSSLLRMPDPEARREAQALFVRDLKRIARRAEQLGP